MYIGRFTNDKDIHIFGRAIGMKYMPGRDEASPEEITRMPWKQKWPNYIRVHSAEFLAGSLSNGVPLSMLMDQLDSRAFATTLKNAEAGSGNTNPRRAYARQPQVELAPDGKAWLDQRLQDAFDRYGKVPLDQFDRPKDIN